MIDKMLNKFMCWMWGHDFNEMAGEVLVTLQGNVYNIHVHFKNIMS